MSIEFQTEALPAEAGPPRIQLGAVGWAKANLFSSWFNSTLTFLSVGLIYYAVVGLFNWGIRLAQITGIDPETCKGIDGACWPVINENLALFMVGTYPFEERWRAWVAFLIPAILLAVAFWPRLRRWKPFHISWLVMAVVVFYLISGSELIGLEPVDTNLWGGLMLTMMLSVVGIVFAFPIGLLLALGRRSKKLPVVKALCVAYIEMIRGVPLITVLFMSSIMLPLFFPEGFNLDKLLRAQIGIIMFAAAYQAETVRGGLQGISKGQEEAAMALGLNYWQTMVFIILPQALRIVIPTLVSGAISLLKDTSLVTIIGLFDLLGITSLVSANPKWLGKIIETYVFVAAIYWVMCFAMSRYAVRLEIKFRAGQH